MKLASRTTKEWHKESQRQQQMEKDATHSVWLTQYLNKMHWKRDKKASDLAQKSFMEKKKTGEYCSTFFGQMKPIVSLDPFGSSMLCVDLAGTNTVTVQWWPWNVDRIYMYWRYKVSQRNQAELVIWQQVTWTVVAFCASASIGRRWVIWFFFYLFRKRGSDFNCSDRQNCSLAVLSSFQYVSEQIALLVTF